MQNTNNNNNNEKKHDRHPCFGAHTIRALLWILIWLNRHTNTQNCHVRCVCVCALCSVQQTSSADDGRYENAIRQQPPAVAAATIRIFSNRRPRMHHMQPSTILSFSGLFHFIPLCAKQKHIYTIRRESTL